MSTKDSRGLTASTSDAAALECYERAAALTHGYFGNPLAVIDEALAVQPDFALGHCLKAAIAVMSSERAGVAHLL